MSDEQKQIEKEKKQLLRVMAKQPLKPQVKWLATLRWLNSKGNPDIEKVIKRLKELEADGLVIRIGHRFALV